MLHKLLPLVHGLLSDSGVFYLVALKQNDLHAIEREAEANGLVTSVVLERRCGIEHLFVVKFAKQK